MRTVRTDKEARFLLTGGPAEADLTERLADSVAPYALNTVGKISYQGTAVLMKRAIWFSRPIPRLSTLPGPPEPRVSPFS